MGHSLDKMQSPQYLDVDGVLVPRSFSRDNVLYATQMRPDNGDVVIAGYPNSGTKTVAIVLHLLTHGARPAQGAAVGMPLSLQLPPASTAASAAATTAANHVVNASLIEWKGKEVESTKPPRLLCTHLPYTKLNINRQAKYIYMLRNPKDCCACAFDDAVTFPQDYDFGEGRFNDFLDLFLQGSVHGNDYFRHVFSWWAHRHEPHVMFVVLEDLRMESRAHVERLLNFVGWRDAIDNSRNVALMQEVLEHIASGPEHTRIMEVRMASAPVPSSGSPDRTLARVTTAGYWKNYFTSGQSKRMDLVFQERTKGTDIARLWNEYNVFPN
ncbi:sulfotransferase ssu-1-like isoform X1 [Dermacentor variabilis]|uniref:sulfotransferase ssu-1-like isoform X1 n=1 Tax=Dermacentor variabilis TaxID=34621 RepID=UPI003F5C23CA